MSGWSYTDIPSLSARALCRIGSGLDRRIESGSVSTRVARSVMRSPSQLAPAFAAASWRADSACT